ncbi:MAG: hypothetical protein IPP64_12275 [Bacteroidetes bacterium]|nr:hypothetical protein [Bacteroidota bacterium]
MKRGISSFVVLKVLLLSFITLLSGCAVRSVYVPTVGNVQLFNEQKQVQAIGYVGTNHVELLAGMNPIKHFSIGVNGSYGKGLAIYEGLIGVHGYSKNEAKWRYELLAGGNYTNNSLQQKSVWINLFKEDKSNYETIGRYNKYFIQPSFGYFGKMEIYKINYSFALSCRTSYIDYKKYIYRELNADSTQLMNNPVYIVNKEFYNKSLYLLEPCITNKVGIRNVSVILEGQFMIPYSKEIDIRYTKFSPVFIFSIGFQYTFLIKKQKKTTT